MQDCGVLAAGVHVRNGYQEREERLDEKNKKILYGTTTAYTGSIGTICNSKLGKNKS